LGTDKTHFSALQTLDAFAQFDTQQHALAVSVGYLRVRHLARAQADILGDAKRGPVRRPR